MDRVAAVTALDDEGRDAAGLATAFDATAFDAEEPDAEALDAEALDADGLDAEELGLFEDDPDLDDDPGPGDDADFDEDAGTDRGAGFAAGLVTVALAPVAFRAGRALAGTASPGRGSQWSPTFLCVWRSLP